MAHWKVPSKLGLSSRPNAIDASKAFEKARTERLKSDTAQGDICDTCKAGLNDLLSLLPLEVVSIIASNLCTYERSESSGQRRAVITSDFFRLRLVCRAWASTFGSIFATLTKQKSYKHYAVLNLPPKSPRGIVDLVQLFEQADEGFRNAVTDVVWHALPSWQIRSEKDLLFHIKNGLEQHQSYEPVLADDEKIHNIARNAQSLFEEYQADQNNFIQDISKKQDGESPLSELLGLLHNVQMVSLQNFDYWLRVDEELNRLRKKASPIMIWHPPISKHLYTSSEFGDPLPYRLPATFMQTLQDFHLHNITSLTLSGVESQFLRLFPAVERRLYDSSAFQTFMQKLTSFELSLARRELVRKRWLYRCDWDFYDRPVEIDDLSNAGRFNRLMKLASSLKHLTLRLERLECLESPNWSWGSYLSKILDDQHWPELETFRCYGFGVSDDGPVSFLKRHSTALREVVVQEFLLDAPSDSSSSDETDPEHEQDEFEDSMVYVHRLLISLRNDFALSKVSVIPRNGGLHLSRSRDRTLRRVGDALKTIITRKDGGRDRWQSYYTSINRWILHQWEP